MTQAMFTGDARLNPLHDFAESPVRVAMVNFPAGVTTYWHSHTGRQLLVVVSGTARVHLRDGETTLVGPGESYLVEPGVDHWHGATEDGPMAHVAITEKLTIWGEAPE